MLRITRALTTTAVRRMDPIQAIFVNKIRQYAADSAAAGGPGKNGIISRTVADSTDLVFASWSAQVFLRLFEVQILTLF